MLGNLLLLACMAAPALGQDVPAGTDLRIAVWDLQGVRSKDLSSPDHPRLKAIAEVLQRLRPNIVLLCGIAYDQPASPDAQPGHEPGQNGQRLADLYLARAQAEDLAPLRYKAFMAPVNSGMVSGMDLDRSGSVVTEYPSPDDPAGARSAAAYSADCWGPGAYPGQLGMALLVDERLAVLADQARTFRRMPWDYMPASQIPKAEDSTPGGLSEAERHLFRLSSAGHWDVPVRLPDGSTLHVLCSQPGAALAANPTDRQRRRAADEVRFWADYTEREPYFVDDRNTGGGGNPDAPVIILGNLGIDPGGETGPIQSLLIQGRRVNGAVTPTSDAEVPGLQAADTRRKGGRTDYIFPSRELGIVAAGVWRHPPGTPGRPLPSDHFPVWMEIRVIPPPPLP